MDPRSIITPDSFRIAPELLGLPLAKPWRRAAAMAVDGLLVAILTNTPGVLFGLVAAFVLFRVSARPGQGTVLRRGVRGMLRLGGAVTLFVVVVNSWDSANDLRRSVLEGDEDDRPAAATTSTVSAGDGSASLEGMGGLRTAASVISVMNADDEPEARRRTEQLVGELRRAGMSDEEIRELLSGLGGEAEKPWLKEVADSAIATLAATPEQPTAGASPDSLAAAYAAALAQRDTARTAELRTPLMLALAGDTLSELRGELAGAERERERLARRVGKLEEEAEHPGVSRVLSGIADDLGLGLGWSGLYFTAFLALWKGHTPGKRLMRIRVVRLDGRPMGWWPAFERFGGYAASLFTGLLGFAQILWDRNRQGMHDKITETVVIND